MSLSNDVVSQFAKTVNGKNKEKTESTVYGTVVIYGGQRYVKMDGSDLLTPCDTTVSANEGERVTVLVKNHTATINGNLSSPSARTGDVEVVREQVLEVQRVVADKATIKDLEVERARIEELVADNAVIKGRVSASEADIGELQADNVTVKGKLEANEASIKKLDVEKLSATDADIKFATIENLKSTNAKVGALEADNATVKGKLEATEANIGELTSDNAAIKGRLTAAEGSITKLDTEKLTATDANIKFATIKSLEAEKGRIEILDSSYANIKNLLSGAAGIGDLQNIHLTSKNAVLEDALIKNAVIQCVSVGDLQAGTILTSKFTIMDPDGGFLIKGPTAQWSDKDGNVRIQVGQDAQKNFTFTLFDETGKGVLIDSNGIKPDAVPEGLVVDRMVAKNAAISGSKLDIPSVVSAINDSSSSISSNRIWMDESGQSLNQAYSRFDKTIIDISDIAYSANSVAAKAASDAKKALESFSDTSAMDAISVYLDNDSHVIHTYTDGTGGDYRDCKTTAHILQGDRDISDEVDDVAITTSDGVHGTWSPLTRTYQIESMSTDDGYVDISVQYGIKNKILILNEKEMILNGKRVVLGSGAAWFTKRFSISKAKDGKVGLSYNLRASSLILRKQKDGKRILPENVTFSAYKNDNGDISSYSGRYKIEESLDNGITYEDKYESKSVELIKIYTPSSLDVNMIRCTLYDENGEQNLDSQTVMLIADAEGLTEDIEKANENANQAHKAIEVTNQRVGKVESGIKGLTVDLSNTTSELHGLVGNSLLYNVVYNDNGDETTTLNAVVYQNGKDVTKEYSDIWFEWVKKTEAGENVIGYGYEITVNNDDYLFGGVVIGRFTTYKETNPLLSKRTMVIGGRRMKLLANAS